MKLRSVFLISLIATHAIAGTRAEASRDLFIRALHYPMVMQKMRELEGSEIVGLRQIFVQMGRGSHTDFEITYGVPDGTGGYRDTACVVLKANASDSVPGHQGLPDFQPSSEPCL